MLLARTIAPTRPTMGMAPVLVGTGAALVGLGLFLAQRQIEAEWKHHWAMHIRNMDEDALYRRPPYRTMSARDLNNLVGLLDWLGKDIYRLPVTGVLIERREIERERLRRVGSGFLFIAPSVSITTLASRLGAIGTLLWGLWAGLQSWQRLQWGPLNGRKQFGPPVTTPAWWPTGVQDPNGLNALEYELETRVQSETFNCEIRSSIQRGTASGGTGLVTYAVREGNPTGNKGPCGNFEAPEAELGYVNQFGQWIVAVSAGTAARVVALNFLSVTVRPYGNPPNPVPYPAAPKPLPLLPQVVPQPMPEVLPETVPLPQREPEPAVVPGTVPLAPPANPNPARRPIAPPIAPPGSRPKAPPIEVGTGVGPDGKVEKPKALPLPVTPPTTEIPWPGAPPIGQPGQQPRPDLVGIAQELGKIERKLAIMNTPSRPLPPALENLTSVDWKRLLWELLQGQLDAGSYSVWSPCLPQGEAGSATDPLVTSWPGSLTAIGGIENRLNALAELIQNSKVLPQPTCRKPALGGEWVTVQFQSDEASPISYSRLRKIFRYLDQNFSPLEDHVDHWRDFSWEAGPWCVSHNGGIWGNPQVWATSADEGKRVIRHAAAIAGVDVDAPGSTWQITRSTSSRTGQPGVMRVRIGRKGNPMISKRDGPVGGAEYLVPADGSTAG